MLDDTMDFVRCGEPCNDIHLILQGDGAVAGAHALAAWNLNVTDPTGQGIKFTFDPPYAAIGEGDGEGYLPAELEVPGRYEALLITALAARGHRAIIHPYPGPHWFRDLPDTDDDNDPGENR